MKFFIYTILLMLSAQEVYAFGGHRPDPKPTPPAGPVETQAFPTRTVSVSTFANTPFTLPDGKTRIDAGADLPSIAVTEMSESSTKLRPTPVGMAAGPYVFSGGITAYEAEVLGAGIKFGWKPATGDIGQGSTQVQGQAKIRVGELSMDFMIIDTSVTPHSVVVAKSVDARELGVTLDFTVDFSQIHSEIDFMTKTYMGNLFRSMIREAVNRMVADPKTNLFLDWSAQIVGSKPDLKNVYINTGIRDGISVGNLFTIYDGVSRLGEVRIIQADVLQSTAVFRDDPDGKLIQSVRAGDTVKVFYINP